MNLQLFELLIVKSIIIIKTLSLFHWLNVTYEVLFFPKVKLFVDHEN